MQFEYAEEKAEFDAERAYLERKRDQLRKDFAESQTDETVLRMDGFDYMREDQRLADQLAELRKEWGRKMAAHFGKRRGRPDSPSYDSDSSAARWKPVSQEQYQQLSTITGCVVRTVGEGKGRKFEVME